MDHSVCLTKFPRSGFAIWRFGSVFTAANPLKIVKRSSRSPSRSTTSYDIGLMSIRNHQFFNFKPPSRHFKKAHRTSSTPRSSLRVCTSAQLSSKMPKSAFVTSLYSCAYESYFRFSKLFMSHLDAEFKKQLIPGVKSLITDQVSLP